MPTANTGTEISVDNWRELSASVRADAFKSLIRVVAGLAGSGKAVVGSAGRSGAEFLFLIAGRAERTAVVLTTSLPFSEWTQVIRNARLCEALLDRITARAHVLKTVLSHTGSGERSSGTFDPGTGETTLEHLQR